MAITLKEAIALSPSVIEKEQAIQKQENEALHKEITEKLDKIIAYNLPKLLVKPIIVTWFFPQYKKESEYVASMYTDFTIYFSTWEQSVSIKLADKDWDWKGYGIKDDKPTKEEYSQLSKEEPKLSTGFKWLLEFTKQKSKTEEQLRKETDNLASEIKSPKIDLLDWVKIKKPLP